MCFRSNFSSKLISTLKVSYLETLNLGAPYSDPMCSRIFLQNWDSMFVSNVLKNIAKSGFYIQIWCAQEYSCKIGVPCLYPMCLRTFLQNWSSIFRSNVLEAYPRKIGCLYIISGYNESNSFSLTTDYCKDRMEFFPSTSPLWLWKPYDPIQGDTLEWLVITILGHIEF